MNQMLKDYLMKTIRKSSVSMRDPRMNPMQVLYHMSAVYGAMNRVFNLEYDKSLVFAHVVLQNAHQHIAGQISKIAAGAQRAMVLRRDILVGLADAIEELGEKIDAGEAFDRTLETIAEIVYSTTGNGHYLRLTGTLKLGNLDANAFDPLEFSAPSALPAPTELDPE